MVRQRCRALGYRVACAITLLTLAACSVSQQWVLRDVSGEQSVLDDARFAREYVKRSWAPEAFGRAVRGGIYLADEYDANRIPVLFIHGMYGSPRDFRYLIEQLDRDRFQAWVFHYPSGARLERIAEQLAQAIIEASTSHAVHSIVIVAHSMGGLIARDALVRHSRRMGVTVPLLITLSTPWEGHRAARFGASLGPFAVGSWHDIAAGSSYLLQLFTEESGAPRLLPSRTEHHLLFSYRRNWSSFGSSSDEVVSVASQLYQPAQVQAHKVYGFDTTHVGILTNASVAALLSTILSSSRGNPELSDEPASDRIDVDQMSWHR